MKVLLRTFNICLYTSFKYANKNDSYWVLFTKADLEGPLVKTFFFFLTNFLLYLKLNKTKNSNFTVFLEGPLN